MNIGTLVGFVCVFALLASSIVMAILNRKSRSPFLSKMALWLFLAAFVGGVAVTLTGGVRPRSDSGIMTGKMMGGGDDQMPPMPGGGPMAAIGKIDQVEFDTLKKKVEKDPNDVKSRERLGHLYLQLQDFENVFRMAHEAIQVDPHSVESRVHMGMVLNAMGEMDQAIAQFDQALGEDSKNTEALLFKGIVQFQGVGDLEGAKITWETFLKVAKPDDPGRPRVTAFLEMIKGQLKKN